MPKLAPLKNWGFRTILLTLLVGSIASAESRNEEYDFSWLDPEKEIYVLQNRKFVKSGHVLISAMGGLGLSGAYVNTYTVQPRIAYYFSDAIGFEALYTFRFNSRNSTFDALETVGSSAIPTVREINGIVGGVLHWAPWYAKINIFNTIVYFDWYFSLGAGMLLAEVDTRTNLSNASVFVDDNQFAGLLGTGHQYHLGKRFVLRVDLTIALYNASVIGVSGDSTWFTNYDFSFGVGLKL